MQVLQLKDHLQQRGLPVNGRKDELIKRLKEEEKCGTVAHDKGNKQQKNLPGRLFRAQPAASSSAIGSTIGDTSSTPSTLKKVRKAQDNLNLFFVPTSPFGAVRVLKYE